LASLDLSADGRKFQHEQAYKMMQSLVVQQTYSRRPDNSKLTALLTHIKQSADGAKEIKWTAYSRPSEVERGQYNSWLTE